MNNKVQFTREFKKQWKKLLKQGKDLNKINVVIGKLANNEELDAKYKNHMLHDSKKYKNCWECHVEPDWLLIYKYQDDGLILLLFATGSHSDLFE